MFTDANLARSEDANLRDDDGAKRVFFGGERFLEGISGEAYVNICFWLSFTCIYVIVVECLKALNFLVCNSLALMVASCSDHSSENSTKQSTWAWSPVAHPRSCLSSVKWTRFEDILFSSQIAGWCRWISKSTHYSLEQGCALFFAF